MVSILYLSDGHIFWILYGLELMVLCSITQLGLFVRIWGIRLKEGFLYTFRGTFFCVFWLIVVAVLFLRSFSRFFISRQEGVAIIPAGRPAAMSSFTAAIYPEDVREAPNSVSSLIHVSLL